MTVRLDRSPSAEQNSSSEVFGKVAMRALLVEDEIGLGESIREHVTASGHAVDWMTTLSAASLALKGVDYDIVLLDLNLPDGSGLDLLRSMRGKGSDTPVIILTARDQISDRITGLNAGADDYLIKPFDLDELTARLGAIARRYVGNPNPVVRFGALEIDTVARRIQNNACTIELTAREWALLDKFLRHPAQVVSKAQLEEALYEFGAEIESNAVEVYVSRLRKKLGREVIETVRGLGYRMQAT